MTVPGEFSYREISTQGASWRSAIEAVLGLQGDLQALMERNAGRPVLFIGCGSTHYLALYAAPFFQQVTGRPSRGCPSSELWLQSDTLLAPAQRPLIVALSRSGETSETIRAVEMSRRLGCEALTISCYERTALAAASTLTVSIPGGREESYAQTRSFAGMLVAVQVLAALSAAPAPQAFPSLLDELAQLPALAEGLIERARAVARRFGPCEAHKRITYLGSGSLYGLAGEATVKMKEMSLSVAEPFHFMEFRHGPMALVDAEHLTVALLSERARAYELGVLRDLQEKGGHVLAIANHGHGLGERFDGLLDLDAPLSEAACGVLYLPLLQFLAYYRALGRGLNPDRPRHVVMAIRLDGPEMIHEPAL